VEPRQRAELTAPAHVLRWRRRSGALLASGIGLTGAAAWYHFQGMASDTTTLIALAIGIALFVGGILAARKARPRP
jgi:hypothetical protein